MGLDMSFVTAAPQELQAAARNLAGIRSLLAESSASAAAPTAAVVAAAQDQVSAQVATLFSAFGQDYQAISAQAQEFHEQFVNLLGAGATAYLGTDAANVEQGLLNAGTVAVLRNGGGGLPAALLAPAAGTGLASIAGPYQTLFQHTAANLGILGNAWRANPAPFLQQLLANQTGYAQTVAAGAEYIIENLPAVLAGLPANIRAFVQALLAFNPVPYVQQFIANQGLYAQIVATSLQNAAHDFGAGLQALPAAFQSAFQALQAGDVAGAVADVAQGFVGLLAPGVAVTTTGNIAVAPGLIAAVTPTGVVGDLLPILTIPGMMAQNLTDLLPPGSIPALISQNFTNVINTVTDTSLSGQVLFTSRLLPPPPVANFSIALNAGLPTALAIEALGAPYNASNALGSTVTTFVDEWQTGNFGGAIGTLIDAPAVVADAFLNGQSTLPINFDLSGFAVTVNLPLNGVLVPPTPYTASLNSGIPVIGTITVPVGGTPLSGLATGLLIYAPEQLALAITPAG